MLCGPPPSFISPTLVEIVTYFPNLPRVDVVLPIVVVSPAVASSAPATSSGGCISGGLYGVNRNSIRKNYASAVYDGAERRTIVM
mmetsp:Transcript_27725/g.59213  ORF Transcript_27725/g.59213 Transcript_27725/m.59213 type:complete len:85 (+) Transcript_27725:322-576(+)